MGMLETKLELRGGTLPASAGRFSFGRRGGAGRALQLAAHVGRGCSATFENRDPSPPRQLDVSPTRMGGDTPRREGARASWVGAYCAKESQQ